MNVAELPATGSTRQTREDREYILYYTSALGKIESAEVIAEGWDTEGPYLVFYRDGRLVTALPHTSVIQFGEIDEANRSFLPENPDDEGSHLVFADEPKDPWAALTGKE